MRIRGWNVFQYVPDGGKGGIADKIFHDWYSIDALSGYKRAPFAQ